MHLHGLGEPFTAQYDAAANVDLLRIDGDVDVFAAPNLLNLIDEAPEGAKVVVDLSRCGYFDSSGVTALIRAYKIRGANLRVVVPEDAVIRKVFEITGMLTVLRVETTVEAATR
jgi:anti-anti-sigma factor